VDVLAIHSKSQTDLVGKDDGYLCRSGSLSCRISSAEGTRPEQMSTDQNHLVEFCTEFLKRRWSTKLAPDAHGNFIGICQTAGPGLANSSPEAAYLRFETR
jgi:hypothetical protein